MSWTSPAGIPTPPFGIFEEVEMYLNPIYQWDYGNGLEPYRVANGKPYTHYVNKNHPSATNTSNPYGSPTVPRLSWPYPVPAGSAIQVIGGTYTFTNSPGSKMAVGGPGTAELPIFLYGITDADADKPVIGATEFYQHESYVIVERIKTSTTVNVHMGTRPSLVSLPAHHIVIRRCRLEGTGISSGTTAISASSASSGSTPELDTKYFVVWNNTICKYGDWLSDSENDACAVIFAENCEWGWMLDNNTFNFGGDSVRIGADQGTEANGGPHFIGRNIMRDNKENAIDVKQARGAVISENICYNFRDTLSSDSAAIVVHYDAEDVWIINNTVLDCKDGIVATGVGTYCNIIGNLFYNCSVRAFYLDRGGGVFNVANNTIYNCGSGIVSTQVIDSITAWNNIIGEPTDVSGYHFYIQGSGVSAASNFTDSILIGSVKIRWQSVSYTTISSWQVASGKGARLLNVDPLFLDSASNNFRIRSTSPAVNYGVSIDSLESDLFSEFGTSLLKDIDSNSLPSAPNLDIGAFQYFLSNLFRLYNIRSTSGVKILT